MSNLFEKKKSMCDAQHGQLDYLSELSKNLSAILIHLPRRHMLVKLQYGEIYDTVSLQLAGKDKKDVEGLLKKIIERQHKEALKLFMSGD